MSAKEKGEREGKSFTNMKDEIWGVFPPPANPYPAYPHPAYPYPRLPPLSEGSLTVCQSFFR